VLWKTWTEGALAAPATDSRVYGEAAGASDTTKIVELRATGTTWVSGLHGRKTAEGLSQFSLITRDVAKTSAAAASSAAITTAPIVAPVIGPVAPVVAPLTPPVLIKR